MFTLNPKAFSPLLLEVQDVYLSPLVLPVVMGCPISFSGRKGICVLNLLAGGQEPPEKTEEGKQPPKPHHLCRGFSTGPHHQVRLVDTRAGKETGS